MQTPAKLPSPGSERKQNPQATSIFQDNELKDHRLISLKLHTHKHKIKLNKKIIKLHTLVVLQCLWVGSPPPPTHTQLPGLCAVSLKDVIKAQSDRVVDYSGDPTEEIVIPSTCGLLVARVSCWKGLLLSSYKGLRLWTRCYATWGTWKPKVSSWELSPLVVQRYLLLSIGSSQQGHWCFSCQSISTKT